MTTRELLETLNNTKTAKVCPKCGDDVSVARHAV